MQFYQVWLDGGVTDGGLWEMIEGCSDEMFDYAHRSVSEDQPPNHLYAPSWYI